MNLPDWSGQEVVVIGGGPSLKDFPFDVLRGSKTVGCNAAFKLGPEICTVVFFGDYKDFFLIFEDELSQFSGPIFTTARKLRENPVSWVTWLPRATNGLPKDRIGWGGNTGCAAISFALLAGARRVYLIGFDMKSEGDKKHWHDEYRRQDPRVYRRPQNYPRFMQGFDAIVRDWPINFPDREIINVTDGSGLTHFPTMPVSDFLKERRVA